MANADTTNEQIIPELYYNYIEARYTPYNTEQYDKCSCVSYAKWKLGISQSEKWGNAWEIQPTKNNPYIGGLILTSEGGGHIGVIVSYDYYSVTFDESNYLPCKYSRRTLSRFSSLIRGYR